MFSTKLFAPYFWLLCISSTQTSPVFTAFPFHARFVSIIFSFHSCHSLFSGITEISKISKKIFVPLVFYNVNQLHFIGILSSLLRPTFYHFIPYGFIVAKLKANASSLMTQIEINHARFGSRWTPNNYSNSTNRDLQR